MKKLLPVVIFLFSVSAVAKTTLKIPVYTEEGQSAAEINELLKAKGIKDSLPLYLEISSKNMNDSYKKYEELAAKVSDLTKLLGQESSIKSENIPNSTMKGTCYTGVGGQTVVDRVFSLAGGFYTEQMNLWGWKYKQKSVIDQNALDNEDEEGATARLLNEQSKLWREWRGFGEAVLILTAHNDGGDDVGESIISKCKF
ncbi:MAG: hypothetical protein AABZ06_02465 [Bdellovibrionota bacterium]